MLITQKLEYQDADTLLEGFFAYNDKGAEKLPAVIVIHDWTGRNDFACNKASKLADLGYVGFAHDMYGKGILGKTKEEKGALIQPFMQDRFALLKRVQAAVNTVKALEFVDSNKIAVIGFCFGGLCALDLARSGDDIRGVVSFHGLLGAPENMTQHAIRAKVLALHGYDDPMATPEQAIAFANEMTAARADWQLTMYGNTMHAFTNPEANDPDFGTVYSEKIDKRSWIAMKDFLREVLV